MAGLEDMSEHPVGPALAPLQSTNWTTAPPFLGLADDPLGASLELQDMSENAFGPVLPQLSATGWAAFPPFLGFSEEPLGSPLELQDMSESVRVALSTRVSVTQMALLGTSDDSTPLAVTAIDEFATTVYLPLPRVPVTQMALLGINDDYGLAPVPIVEFTPTIYLPLPRLPVTQIVLLGISDDYGLIVPVDEYMTIQTIEDWEAQIVHLRIFDDPALLQWLDEYAPTVHLPTPPGPIHQIPRWIGSHEVVLENLLVLVVTPPPAGSEAGLRVLQRGLGLAPAYGALADLAASGIVYALLRFDASYPAGGYPLTPQALGFSTKALTFLPTAPLASAEGYFPVYDGVNHTLRLFRDLGGGRWVEPFPGTNLSRVVMDVAVVGY